MKIGGYNLAKYAKPGSDDNSIVWAKTVDDGWTIPLGGVRFRNSSSNIDIKGEQITLDTGLSYAMAPPEDLETLAKQVKANTNISCAKAGGGDLDLFECDCTAD